MALVQDYPDEPVPNRRYASHINTTFLNSQTVSLISLSHATESTVPQRPTHQLSHMTVDVVGLSDVNFA